MTGIFFFLPGMLQLCVITTLCIWFPLVLGGLDLPVLGADDPLPSTIKFWVISNKEINDPECCWINIPGNKARGKEGSAAGTRHILLLQAATSIISNKNLGIPGEFWLSNAGGPELPILKISLKIWRGRGKDNILMEKKQTQKLSPIYPPPGGEGGFLTVPGTGLHGLIISVMCKWNKA